MPLQTRANSTKIATQGQSTGQTVMIRSVNILNFRCFEKLSLSRLARINVLVGHNASGKTALLEGLFLSIATSPEAVLRVGSWRGLTAERGGVIGFSPKFYEAIWEDLFYSFDKGRKVSIEVIGERGPTRSLKIFYKPGEALALPWKTPPTELAVITPINFQLTLSGQKKGKKTSKKTIVLEPTLTREGFKFGRFPQTIEGAFINPANLPSHEEAASRFSSLSKLGQEGSVLRRVKKLYPFVEGLSVEDHMGQYLLHASVHSSSRKMPLGIISAGLNKLCTILIAMASYPGGVVLVDEIENGFYYDMLSSVWAAILESSTENDTQVFASTHSGESLRGLLESMKGSESEFTLLRTKKTDGQCVVEQSTGKDFKAAIEEKLEIR